MLGGPAPVRAAVVLQTLLFVHYLRENLILQPYWDMFSHVMRYLQFKEGGTWWSYLWEPHVQHRHLWMRLLTAFDVEAFAGVGFPFVVAAVACLLTTAWLLRREARLAAPPALLAAAGGLAVMLVLTSIAAVDAATPINSIYPQTLMFSVLALVLFDRDPGGGGRIGWPRAAGMLSAIAAVFSNSVALVLWPILAWMAWRGRAGRAWLLAVIGVATVFTAVYVYGLPLSDRADAPVPLVERVNYFVTYLGLPWTRVAAISIPGRVCGAALAIVSLWLAGRYGWLRADGGRTSRLAIAFVLFSLGSAALAALGRVDPGAAVLVPVRYAVLLTPLHVGLLMLAAKHVRPARVPIASAAALALAVALLVTQVAAGESARQRTRAMRDTIQRFINGETTPEMERVIYADLEDARRDSDAIRAAGLYLTVP